MLPTHPNQTETLTLTLSIARSDPPNTGNKGTATGPYGRNNCSLRTPTGRIAALLGRGASSGKTSGLVLVPRLGPVDYWALLVPQAELVAVPAVETKPMARPKSSLKIAIIPRVGTTCTTRSDGSSKKRVHGSPAIQMASRSCSATYYPSGMENRNILALRFGPHNESGGETTEDRCGVAHVLGESSSYMAAETIPGYSI